MRGVLPAALITALLLTAAPTLAAWGMPDGIGERMDTINDIYGQIFLAGLVVFLFVMAWMVVVIWRFRPGGAGRRTNEAHRGSIKAELVWTIIPLLIVAWVGAISFQGLLDLEDTSTVPEGATELRLTGFQWFWQVEYENGVTISAKPGEEGSLEGQPAFLFPADQKVLLNMTSGDVIHAMWIPELGVKKDTVPGQNTYSWMEGPEGTYFSQCAEYCGLAHAYMRAEFQAVPQADFENWLEEQRALQISGGNLITVTDTGVEPTSVQAVAGAPFEYLIRNDGTSEVEATFQNATTGPIPSGEFRWLNTTAPEEAGTYQLTVGGSTVSVELLEPEIIEVEMGDFVFDPDPIELEAGKGYILRVTNVHTTIHNLYLGTPQEEAGSDTVLWKTPDLKAGESYDLLVVPEEGGTLTMWCDIPGHYQGGMFGQVTVSP